nr:plantaricin A precursor peptide, induction factor [Lactiplantibacillus plantarum]
MKNINKCTELNDQKLQSLIGGKTKTISLMSGLQVPHAFTKLLKALGGHH